MKKSQGDRLMATQVLHPSVELEFRQYARTLGGAAARAAEEGYDVRTPVLEDVLAQLLDSMIAWAPEDEKLVGHLHEAGTKYQERSNPDAHAFAILDRVRALIANIEKPACLELQVSRIMRATEQAKPVKTSRDGETVYASPLKYTAVLVYIRSPITDEKIVVYRVEP